MVPTGDPAPGSKLQSSTQEENFPNAVISSIISTDPLLVVYTQMSGDPKTSTLHNGLHNSPPWMTWWLSHEHSIVTGKIMLTTFRSTCTLPCKGISTLDVQIRRIR